MTPPSAAQNLIAKTRASGQSAHAVYLPVGHHQMTEAPEATLKALTDFLTP
jgi:pimeloyl-ACP methyl ester carboxylesterase